MGTPTTQADPGAPSSKPPREVLAIGGFAHFVHDGFTDCIYVLLPLWAATFALNHAEVGTLKMTMSGMMAAMQVPAGLLAERWGERVVLALGTMLAGLGFVLLGWAAGFLSLVTFLAVAGAGCGTQHPLVSSIISKAFDSGRRRAALGTYNFTGDLGKVAAPAAVGAGAAAYGWPGSTIAYGLFGVAAGLAVFLLLSPRHTEEPTPRSGPTTGGGPKQGWGINDRRGYATLAVIGMIDGGARLGFLTFVPFLLIEKGAAIDTLGLALALVFAGGAAGKLACGFIAEHVGILRTVVITEVATGALMAAVILLPLVPALVVLPLFGIALNGTSSVLYGTIGDFVGGERQARAYGLYYTLGIGAGALAPVPFGMVSDQWGVTVALAAVAVSVSAILLLCPLLRRSLARAG